MKRCEDMRQTLRETGDAQQGDSMTSAFGERLRAAIDVTGHKHSYIAALCGVPPQTVSQWLSGEKRMQLRHMELLPREVRVQLARLEAEALGWVVLEPQTVDAFTRRTSADLLALMRASGVRV